VGAVNVKIVASIGPASSREEVIDKMVALGVSGFRINFAHGSRETWSRYVELVRDVERSSSRYVSLIGDVVGPSLRLGQMEKPLDVARGTVVRFLLQGKQLSELGTRGPVVSVDVPPTVLQELSSGDTMLMDDGRVSFTIVEIGDGYFDALAQTDSILSPRKAFTVKGKEFDLPILSRKDLENVEFACRSGFDYIGLSYVRAAEDVQQVRKVAERMNCYIGILAKIETLSALRNLDSIIEVSDGVVVARGDLGMNVGLEELPSIQKRVVRRCRELGKPVIVATQLLESMRESPVPTRSEVVDVYEAVVSGVDALMLTGETSVGKYPVEVVRWLSRIVRAAEGSSPPTVERYVADLRTRFVKGIVELAEDLGATIAIYSMRGRTARRVSAMRPRVPVYVGVPRIEEARKLSILWGLNVFVIEASNYVEGLEKLYKHLTSSGLLKVNDIVVLAYGFIEEYEEVIKIRRVTV
jgi:pyruvate kinase